MEIKDQVKRSISIVDVASMYVNLKPAGKYLKALCPFHSEKTPSFFVMPEKNTYTCFGCNRFGDIFTLVQEMENLSFPEAMNFLIDRFQLPVQKPDSRRKIKVEPYIEISQLANAYFVDNLKNSQSGKKAVEYLHKRGLKPGTMELFQLGYSEDSWNGLYDFLTNKDCDIPKAIELGLLIKNEKGRVYDRFRDRIIFPIFSESGSVIAFGGRSFTGEGSKYLNSPDTPLFKKGKHLYGFHLAKNTIREKKDVILVEGYFDMISLFQNGIQNTVASMGTALTELQINLLKRFADKIYMFYDTDKAGIEATVRGIEKMFEMNVNPHVIVTGDVKDPDDFMREHGHDEFMGLLARAVDGFKFVLNKISDDYPKKIPEKWREGLEVAKLLISKLEDPFIRDEYRKVAEDFFDVDSLALVLDNRVKPAPQSGHLPLRIGIDEKEFIECLLIAPEFIPRIKELLTKEILSVLSSENIIRSIFNSYNAETGDFDQGKIKKELNDSELARFNHLNFSTENSHLDKSQIAERIEASFLSFQNTLIENEIKKLNRKIRIAERDDNIDQVTQLMQRKTQFIRKKRKFNGGNTLETT